MPLLTEDEATRKRCAYDLRSPCLADNCMAWREVKRTWLKDENRYLEIGEVVVGPTEEEIAKQIELRGGHGYCMRLGHPDAEAPGQIMRRGE